MGQVKATEWAVPVSFPLGNGQRLVAFPEVSGWAFNSMAMITYDLVGYLVLHSLLVYNKKNMFIVFGFFSNVQYYCVTQWPIVNRSFLFVVVVVVVLFVCFLFVFCLFVFSTSEFPSLSTKVRLLKLFNLEEYICRFEGRNIVITWFTINITWHLVTIVVLHAF